MRATLVVVFGVMFAVGMAGMAVAGSIDSTGAPSSGSGMYSLTQVYDYLNSGIEVTPVPSFQEPSSAPGSTMKTMKNIYDDLRAKYIQSDVTAADVKQGKKFFSTQPGSWGIQTGTLVVPPTPTATPTNTPTTTPTPFGEAECALKGGVWSDTGLGSPGCWVAAAPGQSCTVACAAPAVNLTCNSGNWNDTSTCSACLALFPGSVCWTGSTGVRDDLPSSPIKNINPADLKCYCPRHDTYQQSCSVDTSGWCTDQCKRLCVCMP